MASGFVYRGRHCPLCTRYLNQLAEYKEHFAQAGVDIIAVSADSEAQMRQQLTQVSVILLSPTA